MATVVGSVGLIAILIGVALLIATTGVYFLGRNRMRASSDGFSSIPERGS
jgi:Tfp pilus assembly protein PilW